MVKDKNKRKQMLTALMKEKNYHPMRFRDLCVLLQVAKDQRDELRQCLDELVEEGKIGISSRGKYARPEIYSVSGIFSANPRGFGFVTVEGREQDVFIPAAEVGPALHMDTVSIVITKESEGGYRAEGRVLRVLNRGISSVVGTFQQGKRYGFVVPENKRFLKDVYVPEENRGGALNKQTVIVEITSYGENGKSPEGRITQILGFRSEPGTDILAIAMSHDLPMEFPQDVMDELNDIPDSVSQAAAYGRLDLRSLPTVTIDGPDAKDLDDAISLTEENGVYHLGVHIADVAQYVTEGSALDREALRRGTSAYLLDRVIPMLPQKLSNGICSLNQQTDRLALSVLMDVDHEGTVLSHRIAETVINVDRRMDYPTVAELLTDPASEKRQEYEALLPMFESMKELSQILRERRLKRGAIDFDLPESEIVLNEKGRPVDVHPAERTIANKLIEDFMLLANETVAEEYYWQDLPFVYRIHENPDIEKIRSFAVFINNFGYSLHVGSNELHPGELQRLMEKIEGTDAEALISQILLRSMKQAKYAPTCDGHFGLSARYYCHFTSPIRRYPDLQIHRIIKENLHGRMNDARIDHYHEILPSVCTQASSTERRAQEAEREVDRLKKCQYMRQLIGKEFDGVISGVTNHGLYVTLENTCEGMVALSELRDDYYVFVESRWQLVGERTGRTYNLGQKVRIMVSAVDTELRTVDFSLPRDDWDDDNDEDEDADWLDDDERDDELEDFIDQYLF